MKKILLTLILIPSTMFAEVREFQVIKHTPQNIVIAERVLLPVKVDEFEMAVAEREIAARRTLGMSCVGVRPSSFKMGLSKMLYLIPKTTRNQSYQKGKVFRIDCVDRKTFEYNGKAYTNLQVLSYDPKNSQEYKIRRNP